MLNYYQILGISTAATPEEIKVAFKKKAVEFHPDKHHGDVNMEALFKEVNSAYQTLSNPYSKSSYDLSLKYGALEYATSPAPKPTYQKQPYDYRRAPFRQSRHTKKFDSKENLRATFYAFLFAFIVGVIVKTGMWALDYVRAEEQAELLAARRMIFGHAQEAYKLGELDNSLELLESFKYFYPSEVDIKAYKNNLLLTIITRANRYFKNQKYQQALEVMDILESYPISATLDFKLKKAKAYKEVGDYQNTLEIYEELYKGGYRTTAFYYEIGLTYEQGGHDFEQAVKFYEVASKYAAAEYESSMGKAYAVIISPKLIPKLHYDIYMRLANAYYETGAFEKSIKSLIWTKEMWPDSAINYYISAKSYQALNEVSLACAEFNMAKFKDYSIEIPDLCK